MWRNLVHWARIDDDGNLAKVDQEGSCSENLKGQRNWPWRSTREYSGFIEVSKKNPPSPFPEPS